jgi:hypothetical protein
LRFALALLVPAIVCAQTTSYKKQRAGEREANKKQAVEARVTFAQSETALLASEPNHISLIATGEQATELLLWSPDPWTKKKVDDWVGQNEASLVMLGFREIAFKHPASAQDDPATVRKGRRKGIDYSYCIFATFSFDPRKYK